MDINFSLDRVHGKLAMIEIACLPGQEALSFMGALNKFTNPGTKFPLLIDKQDFFPFNLQCVCGYNLKITDEKSVPASSVQCSCGMFLIKYNQYQVH